MMSKLISPRFYGNAILAICGYPFQSSNAKIETRAYRHSSSSRKLYIRTPTELRYNYSMITRTMSRIYVLSECGARVFAVTAVALELL
uniref:Uncharacterized protein n=1 Tax=Trichogramma kaykai TaxID=54128 RepID=A0ABD2XAI4_9HYME